MKNGIVKPATGKLLISEPFMMDSYFQRSVVLLTEHGNEGTIGFILNKQTNVLVCDVLNGFPESDIPLSGKPFNTSHTNTLVCLLRINPIVPSLPCSVSSTTDRWK